MTDKQMLLAKLIATIYAGRISNSECYPNDLDTAIRIAMEIIEIASAEVDESQSETPQK